MSDPQPVPSRNIAKIINELEGGDFQHELSNAVQDLMADMEEVRQDFRGKPEGSVTITLKFKNDDGVIDVKSEFKVSKPKRPRRKTIYWLTDQHLLSLTNPRQLDMGFRDVNRRDQAIDA